MTEALNNIAPHVAITVRSKFAFWTSFWIAGSSISEAAKKDCIGLIMEQDLVLVYS